MDKVSTRNWSSVPPYAVSNMDRGNICHKLQSVRHIKMLSSSSDDDFMLLDSVPTKFERKG